MLIVEPVALAGVVLAYSLSGPSDLYRVLLFNFFRSPPTHSQRYTFTCLCIHRRICALQGHCRIPLYKWIFYVMDTKDGVGREWFTRRQRHDLLRAQ